MELLCASYKKDATQQLCVKSRGKKAKSKDDFEIKSYNIYSPKAFALIGQTPPVLADRSLPVYMERRLKDEIVAKNKSRVRIPRGAAVKTRLELFAAAYKETAVAIYEGVEGYDLSNDRMSDLLIPLQVVTGIEGVHWDLLEHYAFNIDERDKEQLSQSQGVRLLLSMRTAFGDDIDFFPTDDLLTVLNEDEQWRGSNYGKGLGRVSLANLLSEYNIGAVKQRKSNS